jgi:SNF2 family DNA or RNA helicase
MKSAWQQDLFRFAMHRSVSVAYGDAKQRKKIIEEGSEFVVINFDGVEIVKDALAAGNFDLVVVDEATAYKTVSTNRWKVFKELSDKIPYLWMLTGTPAAQSPLDAYGLAKLVNPQNSPRSFSQFRDKIMYRVTQYKWVPREGATEIAHNMLQPAIRFEKRACLDLPPVLHTEREAPLTAMQVKYYKDLKHKMMANAAGEQITSVNAAANLNKLLQVSGGAVYTDTGATVEFDVSNRLNVVLEAIEEASAKVLVFVPYTHTINLLKATLDKHGIESEIINGAVNPNKRTDIVNRFQNSPKTRVLILQPAAASHGLTLTEADTIIWYQPVTSVETYLQANARIDRPGQKNNMTIIHISGSEVERKLYDMLRNNIDTHGKLVELYRQEIGK